MLGDWFGRPLDNIHIVRSAVAEGDDLVVTFDEYEQLRVSDPGDWEFGEHTFRVQRASRVVWRWYYYGSPTLPENLFTIEHWIDDQEHLRARSDVTWYTPIFGGRILARRLELL